MEQGATVTKPTDPIKDGYIFKEWLYNNATFDFTTPITQDIVLTAYFERAADVSSPNPGGVNTDTGEDK